MRSLPLVLLTAMFLTTGCKKKEAPPPPSAAAPLPAPPVEAPPPEAPPVAAAPVAEPGSILELKRGEQKLPVRDTMKVTASGKLASGGHFYVVAPMPPVRADGSPMWHTTRRYSVRGPRHGAVAEQTGVAYAASPTYVLVRLVGEDASAAIDVDAVIYVEKGHARQPIHIDGIEAAPAEPALESRFFTSLATTFEHRGQSRWGRVASFHSFAAGRAQLLSGGKAAPLPVGIARTRRGELGDMMSLYTGALSIEEALQTDRGLLLREADAKERTIPIDTLTGVPLAAHPWDKLIAGLGQAPVLEELAAVVPSDVIYLHTRDLRTLVKLAGDLDDFLTPLAAALEEKPGPTHLVSRYEEALMVERLGLAEKLGHIAASEVAIVASDPFLREGTDVSVVFQVKSRALLGTALDVYEAKAKARHADLAESTYTVGAHTVRVMSTPDRAVNQHRVELGEVLIVSNSRRAIERFAAVADGKLKALKDSGDFRYMRARYPYSVKNEDVFAFVGDDLVAHAVAPRTKILQARRLAAQADLAAVGYSVLLHGWLEGARAASLDDVKGSGILRAEDLKHADGTDISFSMDTGASSPIWGRRTALTPILDLDIDKVTPDEKAAYERFRDTYQRNWSGYIDPIAAQIVRGDDGKRLSVDARMLPLIAGTDYDELVRMVGEARVQVPKLRGGIQFTLGVGADARLRRDLQGLEGLVKGLRLSWVGGWATLAARSSSALYDLTLLASESPLMALDERKAREDALMERLLPRAPIVGGVHVANPLALAASLAAVKTLVDRSAPGLAEWADGGKHLDVPIVTVKSAEQRGAWFSIPKLEIHYATAKDVFLVSLDRPTLTWAIDEVMDGRGPTMAEGKDDESALQTSFALAFGEPDEWLTRALVALLEASARRGVVTGLRDVQALREGLREVPASPEAFRRAALAYLGYEPHSAQGGTFTAGEDGAVRHSLYGSAEEPAFPDVPIADGALTKLARSIEALTTSLGFEGKDDSRGLHVSLELKRR